MADPPPPLALTDSGPLWQVAGWEGFEAALGPVLDTAGIAGIGGYRKVAPGEEVALFRIAPDRVLLSGAGAPAIAAQAAGDGRLVALDLSDAFGVLRVDGPDAEALLSRLLPVDVALSAFPAGEFRQTAAHGIRVLIHRTDPCGFDLLVPRSWGESLRDFAVAVGQTLGETGSPAGIGSRPPTP